jgi:L-seryl-tRNA(Ser) seleniumtransferase
VVSSAAVGGGGAPEVSLDSAAVALPVSLAEPLRLDAELPVVGRVERGRLLLDLIAVAPEDDAPLAEAVRRAAAPSSGEA